MDVINQRKYHAIDILKMYWRQADAEFVHENAWNDFLTRCLQTRNINDLAIMRYRVQAGMDDLAKAKLNTEEIIVFYLRLLKSLENTAKTIFKLKFPNPNDNSIDKIAHSKATFAAKVKRDHELEHFLKASAY